MAELEKLYKKRKRIKESILHFFDDWDHINFSDLEYQAHHSDLKDIESEIKKLEKQKNE